MPQGGIYCTVLSLLTLLLQFFSRYISFCCNWMSLFLIIFYLSRYASTIIECDQLSETYSLWLNFTTFLLS